MNIIIPLGGLGERFKNEGYLKPKPLVKILGKEMIFYLIDNLVLEKDDRLFIIYNKDLDKFNFETIIKQKYRTATTIQLNKNTGGAAETILIGLNNIDKNFITKKTILLDCDTFYFTDVVSAFRNQTKNAVFCFRDTQEKPIYSYVTFESDNIITSIKEKVKISEYANTGCYCFESAETLKIYCKKIIDQDIRFGNEYYTSCVISEMIKDGHIFRANIIDKDEFKCVGTPLQLKIFCSNSVRDGENLRICFDLDNTLVTSPETKNDYSTVKPIFANIELLRYFKKLGHIIIIYTARRMRTHNGNIGKIVADIGKITLDTLDKFNIPYDEIVFGKPYANYYIDDLAINANDDIEKEIGIYKTTVNERDFNEICSGVMEIVTKKSNNTKLKGEIYYYQNIPSQVKKYFPIFINYGSNWYSMEKINGITLSYLFVNESVTKDLFLKYLNVIKELHMSASCVSDINIYSNYCEKLEKRYSDYDYTKYNSSEIIYQRLKEYFSNYEINKLGQCGVIHGDPVFTNCILDLNNNFKLIDMRGQMGTITTIFGDIFYDYGKIYQSLTGYDEILMNKVVSQSYKKMLIETFELFINENHPGSLEKIKMIRNMLLFTLIPLHNDEKCHKYFNLIN